MIEPLFTGVGVALVTLFASDGSLDAAATADHAARLVDLGVQAVVVAGSTGEAAALERDERVALFRAVREAVDRSRGGVRGAVPVLAGTGAPSARQAAVLTAEACDAGADGLLVLSPPGSDDVRPYYDTVAEAAGAVPVLAYHYPSVSPPGIPVGTLSELPVHGCKDSSGDPNRLLHTLECWDRPLYVGSSALLSMAGPLGCAGAILALANAEPEGCIAAWTGDAAAQRTLANAHRQSRQAFPAGIKNLTAARFGTSPVTRMG